MTTTPSNRKISPAHAVVIGGSMAGMLAARVLSERFERVTILEKDHFPATAENRKSVPQGRHVHGLLAGGFRAMEALFPDLKDELLSAGAEVGDVVGDGRWHQFGRYKARFDSGLEGITVSRPLLEATVRGRVLALPNVGVVEGARVRGLLTTADKSRVTGVRFQRSGGGIEALQADLTLDASGRGSRTPAWLGALGYPPPAEDEIRIDMGYTSRCYRREPSDLGGDFGAIVTGTPPHERRTGTMLRIDGDRWHVTLGGFLGDRAPADEAGFLAFARSLPAPDVYDFLEGAEPVSEFATYRFPSSLRRRYERLVRFPEGVLVTGDAVCSFNPVYGQGMSVAALEALALRESLAEQGESLDGLHRRFFHRAARVVDTPWGLAAGADFAYPEVEGKRPFGAALTNRYVAGLHAVAAHDEVVCRAFFEVLNLLAPPASLFRPRIALRVLRGRRPERRPVLPSVLDSLPVDDLGADAPGGKP